MPDTRRTQLFDCWVVYGDEDAYGFTYIKNERYRRIRAKHNVTLDEARAWHTTGARELCADAYKQGLYPSVFYTVAEPDETTP